MRCRPVHTALLAMLALALPSGASAAYFTAAAVDGPSPDIQRLGAIDVAFDGTGGLIYLKNVGGVPHVFASRLAGGVWQRPEQLDASLGPAASQPVIAAGNGGRDAAVFVSGGQVFAVVRPVGATAWSPPALLSAAGSDPSVSMSIHGEAYATWTATGPNGVPNVFAAQMQRTANAFSIIGQPLNVDPAQPAGLGARRSRVVATADGSGIAVWGEAGADGRGHVYVRRILGGTLSLYPQDATLATEPGTGAAAASADSPEIAVRSDPSFAWLVFRQDFTDGSHIIMRPLVGALLDPGGVLVGAENATNPRIVANSAGDGLATASGRDDFAALGNVMHDNTWLATVRLDTPPAGILATPVPTFPDAGFPSVSWVQDPAPGDGAATVHMRQWEVVASKRNVPAPDPDTVLSNPALGVVDPDLGFDASGDRIGDVAVAFVQGDPTARSIVVAGFDRLPVAFSLSTNTKFKPSSRPVLSWGASNDLWGPVTYNVLVDGVSIGTTQQTKFTPVKPITDGNHTWKVIAGDLRGQTVPSSGTSRALRIDATPPVPSFVVLGRKLRKNKAIKFTVSARDLAEVLPPPVAPPPPPPGTPPAPVAPRITPVASGVATVSIGFGDGTPTVVAKTSQLRVSHVYHRAGFYTVSVAASDRAGGHSKKITRRIHIGK
jgi:hypothetical protein